MYIVSCSYIFFFSPSFLFSFFLTMLTTFCSMGINIMKSHDTFPSKGGERTWRRVLWALPLLGIFWAARTVLSATASKWLPILEEAVKTGLVQDVSGQLPLRTTYTGIEGLDRFVSGFVAFFTPAIAGLDHSEFQFLGKMRVTDSSQKQ
jgi:hypothetical protein